MSFPTCVRRVAFLVVAGAVLVLSACGGSGTLPAPQVVRLAVNPAGNGQGIISSTPAGINCGSACSATFARGTNVTLTATPGSTATFGGWTGACQGTASCNITLNTDVSVGAAFAAWPVLSVGASGAGIVTSSPSGIECGPTCSAAYPPGTQVTLTAAAGSGGSFSNWGGACSGQQPSCTVTLSTDMHVTGTFVGSPTLSLTLNTKTSGNVATGGSVISNPPGISCPGTCQASFPAGSQVTLTESLSGGSPFTVFAGWGGACSGSSATCTLSLQSNQQVQASFNFGINHIIFMAQENRSFDQYFGELRQYWADHGYPDQPFDGLPQFNPPTDPNYGLPPSNPGCDPNATSGPPFSDCVVDSNSPQISSFHLITQCIENPSPFWNEAHYDLDWSNPTYDLTSSVPPPMNGFVSVTAHDSKNIRQGQNNGPYYDTVGMRVMGYYDGGNPNNPNDPGDLNYYYFMASNFGTSDRWFNPLMTRTDANRDFLIAATSQGNVYPVGTFAQDTVHTAPTIFQQLQNIGVTWKIYVNPTATGCTGPPYQASCLIKFSYLMHFKWGQAIPQNYPNNIGSIGPSGTCGATPCDFENDLANGTLPEVVLIEPASPAALDEHGSNDDRFPVNIQAGAKYLSSLINALMLSSAWKDSAFILTYDEYGGMYDHVPPQPAYSPDGTANAPNDLQPGDVCYSNTSPSICSFQWTGYRVPLIVISPYSKRNYVSHTIADTTAILKFIETRYGLAPLTLRDANQLTDMTEFFDFANPAWMQPPRPPVQNTGGACYLDHLP